MTAAKRESESCPLKGKHISPMHLAACPVCNPTKTVPELNVDAGALRTSNPLLQRIDEWEAGDGQPVGLLLGEAADEIERLREFVEEIAGEDCRHYTKGLCDKPPKNCVCYSCRARAALADKVADMADRVSDETTALEDKA